MHVERICKIYKTLTMFTLVHLHPSTKYPPHLSSFASPKTLRPYFADTSRVIGTMLLFPNLILKLYSSINANSLSVQFRLLLSNNHCYFACKIVSAVHITRLELLNIYFIVFLILFYRVQGPRATESLQFLQEELSVHWNRKRWTSSKDTLQSQGSGSC